MLNVTRRQIDQMIEAQVRRWQAQSNTPAKTSLAGPNIAISRLPGCAGRAIALELARRLGFCLFDKEILENVAKRSHMSVSQDYFWHLSRSLRATAKLGRLG
jgi:hypothetical protein